MKYFCIMSTERAAPALLRACPFSIRGLGAFIEAESMEEVLRIDATLGGKLTEKDIYGETQEGIKKILAHVPKNRR